MSYPLTDYLCSRKPRSCRGNPRTRQLDPQAEQRVAEPEPVSQSQPQPGNSNGGHDEQPAPAPSQPAPAPSKRGPLPQSRRRGRSRRTRDLSRSPTPGSTDHELEPDESTTQEQASTYAYTHIKHSLTLETDQLRRKYGYDTLSEKAFVALAKKKFGDDVATGDTQEVLERFRVAPRSQAPQVESSRQPTSVSRLINSLNYYLLTKLL